MLSLASYPARCIVIAMSSRSRPNWDNGVSASTFVSQRIDDYLERRQILAAIGIIEKIAIEEG